MSLCDTEATDKSFWKHQRVWLFEEGLQETCFTFILDKKQEVFISRILTHRNQILSSQLAKDHGIRFFETSAKSSINVEEVSWNVTTELIYV